MTTSIKASIFQPLIHHVSRLPSDVLINIFKWLDTTATIHIGLSCRTLHQVQETETLWQFFCFRDLFSGASHEKKLPSGYRTWKIYYQQFESALLVPYPGKGATFRLIKDWRVKPIGAPLIRSLSFKSETPGSLFKNFSLFGYEDGSVYLSVTIAQGAKIDSYFKKLSLEKREDFSITGRNFLFSTSNNKRKMFKVIKTFNQINKEHLALAERLAFSTNWRFITPLTAEETHKLVGDKQNRTPLNPDATWVSWLSYHLIFKPLFESLVNTALDHRLR